MKRHITAVSKLYSALSTTSTSTTIRVAIFISLCRINQVFSALLKSVSQRVSDKARQWSNSCGKIAKKAFLGKRNPDHLLISDLLPKRQQSSSDVFSAYNTVSIETKMSNKLWFSYLSWSIMAKTSPTSSLAFLSSNTLTVGLLCLLKSQAGIPYSNLAIARRNSSTSTVPDLEIRIPKCCMM